MTPPNSGIRGVGGPRLLGIRTETGSADPVKRIDDLEKKANNVEERFDRLERSIDRSQSWTGWIVGAVAVGFLIGLIAMIGTVVLLAEDYFHAASDREKYVTQETLDKEVYNFKNCIWFNGLTHCLK